MISRKTLGKPKKEKSQWIGPRPRGVSRSLKIDDLPLIVDDGKLLIKKGDSLYIRRDHRPVDPQMSLHTVMSISGSFIETYDETLQQWFAFSLEDLNNLTVRRKL